LLTGVPADVIETTHRQQSHYLLAAWNGAGSLIGEQAFWKESVNKPNRQHQPD